MTTFTYNDTQFSLEAAGNAWDIQRHLPDGKVALVGSGLFAGTPIADAKARALSLVKAIYPVGIKSVGPDVAHPNLIGGLRIIGPDVAHPNFIYWDKDSISFPK